MFRPALAPGLRVLRRSRGELQVGLRPEVRLPDTEPVRRTLDHLVRGEAVPDDPATRDVLAALAPVLVDGSALLDPQVAAADVAAVAAHDPSGYRARLAARRHALVSVRGRWPGVDPAYLLGAAGLRATDAPHTDATAELVLWQGEIDRAELDDLVRNRTPYLLLRMLEGAAVLGPFVEPGRTACLRCIDAHRSLDDPYAATLATRHAAARTDRQDGVAEPVDSALATLAVAWAVRDLVTQAEGERPSTWSSTIRVAPTLTSVTQTEWLRHPACGCNWLADEQVSRTMAL
jgi:bacteriocin biosynthesis cyclodehydratase domain-containing protein